MNKYDEQILVVKRKNLFDNEKNFFNGFLNIENEKVKNIIENFKNYEIKRRGNMENDFSYKQLIGYTIIKDKNTGEILVYTRLSGGGESRLHGKSSVGVGGHMNDVENKNILDIVKINAAREIEEEIGINISLIINNIRLVGLINDDSIEVGKFHIGLVYIAEIDKKNVIEKEKDSLLIRWLNTSDAKKISNYESWSEFLKPIF